MSQGTPRNNSKLHRFCGKLETDAKKGLRFSADTPQQTNKR